MEKDTLLSIIMIVQNDEEKINDWYTKFMDAYNFLDASQRNMFEVIIVDNNSNDNTFNKLKEVTKGQDFKIFRNEKIDWSSSLTMGIDKAQGKYLKINDIKDWVKKDYLVALEEGLSRDKEFVYANFYTTDRKTIRKLKPRNSFEWAIRQGSNLSVLYFKKQLLIDEKIKITGHSGELILRKLLDKIQVGLLNVHFIEDKIITLNILPEKKKNHFEENRFEKNYYVERLKNVLRIIKQIKNASSKFAILSEAKKIHKEFLKLDGVKLHNSRERKIMKHLLIQIRNIAII